LRIIRGRPLRSLVGVNGGAAGGFDLAGTRRGVTELGQHLLNVTPDDHQRKALRHRGLRR
jgi:hypothetical protein